MVSRGGKLEEWQREGLQRACEKSFDAALASLYVPRPVKIGLQRHPDRLAAPPLHSPLASRAEAVPPAARLCQRRPWPLREPTP